MRSVQRKRHGPPKWPLVAGAVLVAALGAAARLDAHVVYGTPTVHQLTLDADLVAHARVTVAHGVVADGRLRRPVVTVELLEVLKGGAPCGPLTFAPHGHGVAEYENGEEILLFLRHIERASELARTPLAEKVAWVSPQERSDEIALTPAGRDAYLAAVRAYVAVDALPTPAAVVAGLRRVTVRLLGSREPRLAASAVRDLVAAADAPLVTAEDLPALEPLLADPTVAIGTRVALLAELERRVLIDGPPHWVRLLRADPPADRMLAVRAVAAHPSAPVTRELLALLDGPTGAGPEHAGAERDLAAAAAVSLGMPGNDAAVAALARAFGRDDARLRMAAIRGLGRVGTAGARRALETAAAFHPDPATRRRAGAELAVLARHGSVAAPAPAL